METVRNKLYKKMENGDNKPIKRGEYFYKMENGVIFRANILTYEVTNIVSWKKTNL